MFGADNLGKESAANEVGVMDMKFSQGMGLSNAQFNKDGSYNSDPKSNDNDHHIGGDSGDKIELLKSKSE